VSPPRTLYARSGGVDLAYQVVGDGPRDVVLALDWASHLEVLWEQPFVEEFISVLTRFARVLWFDTRGVGLSDRVTQKFAAEDWMEDVGTVMDAAGSERATLMAHGHAAQMALVFAATYPDRVESLVLINGFARLARADDYPAGMPAQIQETILNAIETEWGSGSMAAILGPTIAGRPGVQDWYGRVERYSASPRTAGARMRVVLASDVRHVLSLVAAPTLVLHSRQNALVRADHGRYLAEHIPHARLIEWDSPDHWPLPDPIVLGAIEEFVTGSRSEESGSERFLATVMFTDVAGSTEWVSEVGDRRWRMLQDRFEETVRRALATYRGELVSTAGDGVLATFDGPARGIRCACQIRDALRHNGLVVRSGLHTGEVTRHAGDIAGIAVHIGARVSSAAAPGEVLVTRTVRDLVAGSGIDFEDRGEHELKGVPERWTLYAAGG
jgi:class 3 adenylate cyclase